MNNNEYEEALARIDKLLETVDNNMLTDSTEMLELIKLSDQIEEFEEKHYPIPETSFLDKILFYWKQRINESKFFQWKKKKV